MMPRLVSLISLSLATLLPAQQPAAPVAPVTPPPVRTVLRALPLGGDDDINSRPTPPPAVVSPTPPAGYPTPPAAPVTQPLAIPAAPRPLVPATPPAAPPVLVKPQAPTDDQIRAIPSLASLIPSPLNVKPTGDDALRLQIFLDESNFGPGIIDGKPGRFTELAVQSWNEVKGHPIDDWVAANSAARKAVPNPLATAVVPAVVKDWVDSTLPYKYSLQAKRKRMSYRSIGEFMSERYHCSLDYLLELNGSKKINNLKAGDTLMVPNVTPFHIEMITGTEYKADNALSMRHAVVDTKINQVRIFEAAPPALVIAEPGVEPVISTKRSANRGLIASFPITPGQPKFIKFGTWEVRNSVELPYWRYDQKLLESGKRSADSESLNIPPGPNSPVGIFWCGLNKPGIGLHGTSNPETIGRARSAGCIRLANWDAIRLPTLIRPGTTVEIR